jgi:pyruvate,water dikinase
VLDPDEIDSRRRVHAGYATLPPLPGLIRGRFDPVAWAADPDDRVDPHGSTASTSVGGSGADDVTAPRPSAGSVETETVTGFAGSAGVVEGTARVILAAADGARLRPGEVLVTNVTNVGWTPLFPRAAAVVTNVGAPLSHAAIVARELGIPAVVGCGTATEVIRDGDRVRVDGSAGVVQVLRP